MHGHLNDKWDICPHTQTATDWVPSKGETANILRTNAKLFTNLVEIISPAHGNFEEQNKVLESSIIIINYRVLINSLNVDLNSVCHLLALLEAHHIFHFSGLRVNAYYNYIINA